MAFTSPTGPLSFEASTGLTSNQFVRLTTNAILANPTAGDHILGVLVSSGTTGSTVTGDWHSVQVMGVAKVRCATGSTGISANTLVVTSSKGRAAPTTAGDFYVGLALEDVSSTKSVISVLLNPYGST